MKLRLPRFNLLASYLISVSLVSILPLLLVGLISFSVSRGVIQDEASRYTTQLVTSQKDYLDLALEQSEALITNIFSVETITTAISQPHPASDLYTNLATQAQIGYILNGYTNLKGLVSIDLYALNGDHFHVGDTLSTTNIRSDIKDRIYNEILKSGTQMAWLGVEENINADSAYKKVITIGKLYSQVDTQSLQEKPIAMILVNYDISFLYDHLIQSDLGKNAYLMVVDKDGRIIFHPEKALIGASIDPDFFRQIDSEPSTSILTTDGQQYIVDHVQSAVSGWTVMSVIPLANFTAKVAPIETTIAVSILACILVTLFFVMRISHRVLGPIRQITARFKMFQAGVVNWNNRLIPSSRDEIGDLVHWFNAFSDNISALQKSEQALRDSEERYALAVQGANDGLWDWDLKDEKIYLSPRWKIMLGYADGELSDDPAEWFERVHPEDRENLQAALANHLSQQTPHFEIEHRIQHKNKAYLWFLARGLAIFDHKGQPYRMAGSHSEITNRKQAEEQLRHDAYNDALTNLPNRSFFFQQLQQAILRNREDDSLRFAVLFLDFDRFKLINDSMGHHAGDKLLVKIAERLITCLRASDTVARLGGDEFSILLAEIGGVTDATLVAGRILAALSQPVELEGQHIVITASIGIVLNDAQYSSPDDYLRDADTAMYWAKSHGKARYEIFDIAMRENIIKWLELENELRRAIDEDELLLHYQPIIDLGSSRIRGLEALVRWRHPQLGLISPADFIPIAEETGLILPIGDWVMQRACNQAVEWRQRFGPSYAFSISVNVSAKQFAQESLVPQIEKLLIDTGLDASGLHLEITESVLINDPKATSAMINQLRDLGVKVEMDDFGSGYSSLSNLTQFNVDTIKIGQSFIAEMQASQANLNLVENIIHMAHSLGMNVVAEGIETEEQLRLLKGYGCERGQGYYFARALGAEDAENFILQNLKLHL
jgi:diguanylate cyclase (GGDEF)-like protein/PAS domain S-box-containing protein